MRRRWTACCTRTATGPTRSWCRPRRWGFRWRRPTPPTTRKATGIGQPPQPLPTTTNRRPARTSAPGWPGWGQTRTTRKPSPSQATKFPFVQFVKKNYCLNFELATGYRVSSIGQADVLETLSNKFHVPFVHCETVLLCNLYLGINKILCLKVIYFFVKKFMINAKKNIFFSLKIELNGQKIALKVAKNNLTWLNFKIQESTGPLLDRCPSC